MIFAGPYARIGGRWAALAYTLTENSFKDAARKELALLLGLLFLGLVIAPIAIFWIGQSLLGDYGGYGYGHFFGNLSARIRGGDPVAWFVVLSPYLAWQVLRLMLFAWRRTT